MTLKIEHLRARELRPLGELYPRDDPDERHVASLVEALKAGNELPPLLVDGPTKRVVDGLHRLTAYTQLRGPDAPIPVVLKYYQSQEDLFLDAVAANSKHGRRFDHRDKARCLLLAQRLKIEPERLANALAVTTAGLNGLRITAASMKPGASANRQAPKPRRQAEARETTLADAPENGTGETVFGVAVGQQSSAVRATHYAASLSALLECGALNSHRKTVEGSFKRLTDALRKFYGVE